jgi:DNA/RNA endonuclease YhcR with UshA esterase domain
VVLEEESVTMPYGEYVMGTSVEMQDLTVVDAYTTNNGGSSDGAMTLTCEANGVTVTVRTAVLLDENNERITADAYLGKTIDVRGIVDLYDGSCQIKVFAANNITIK